MKNTSKNKKSNTKKRILISVLALGAGVLGVYGFLYWKKTKKKRDSVSDDTNPVFLPDINNPTTTNVNNTVRPRKRTKTPEPVEVGFPLKKGSKGDLVQKLQEALIKKHGKQILPKYGADGDFGTETINALKKVGLPEEISQSTYNVIVQDAAPKEQTFFAAIVAKEIYDALVIKSFEKIQAALLKISNTKQYNSTNIEFKKYRINGGVTQTIVNAVLTTFSDATQKEQIKYSFLRIGLEFDGNKWTISGLEGIPIITIMPTTVWVDGKKSVQVPERMFLGKEVNRKLDYTLFRNKNRYFLVPTKSVDYL